MNGDRGGATGGTRATLLFAAAAFAELLFINAAARHGDFARAGEALVFVPLILLAGVAFFGAVRCFTRLSVALHTRTLWGLAIALRISMFACAPGDDFWRYVWEGRVQTAGENPYLHSPLAPELQRLRDADWPRINHPEVAGDLSARY